MSNAFYTLEKQGNICNRQAKIKCKDTSKC